MIDYLMDLNGGLLAFILLKQILDRSLALRRFILFFALSTGLALVLTCASTFI